MGRKIASFLFALLFLAGFGILTYPTISDQWNTYRQSKLISTYDTAVRQLTEEDFEEIWAAARQYNDSFQQNSMTADVFGIDGTEKIQDTEYWKVLNISGDGVMGYLTIPKINIRLSIYHGTSEDVLDTGVGHMNGTKLPIGGANNHTVLSAHRGLPSAKLFTDIDQLGRGDRFYLHILNEDLAYEVDRVLPMIPKDDHDALEEAAAIEDGQDQVTLFTCTPYGVNSHRLLVRGHRVPYDGELESTPIESMVQAIQNYYMLYLLLGLGVTILAILILRRLILRKPKRQEDEAAAEVKSDASTENEIEAAVGPDATADVSTENGTDTNVETDAENSTEPEKDADAATSTDADVEIDKDLETDADLETETENRKEGKS